MRLWTNACLHQRPSCARRKPPERSVVVPFGPARSSFSGWEVQVKVRRIVTSSSSVGAGAAVLQKSGFLHCCKACGRVCRLRCLRLKNLAALVNEFLGAMNAANSDGYRDGNLSAGSSTEGWSNKVG